MKTLKNIISKYMFQIAAVFVAFILLTVLLVLLATEQKQAYEDASETFELINNRLEENQQELTVVQQEYEQTCLYNAKVIADIIEGRPDILNDVKGLKELAALLEVDEIHVFDTTGRIFTGTHPEYYGYTFDSGEQMRFFKPMLKDKTLQLVQDITPNTAVGKLMQYSAVWSGNGEYIIQVGMEPVSVNKGTAKNEMSYIFSTFKLDSTSDFYDIDAESGNIIGSTNVESIGHNIEETGISFDKIKTDSNGFHAYANGDMSFCVFQKNGGIYLGKTVTINSIYQRIPYLMLILSICMVFIAFILVHAVTKNMNKYVVDEIHDINSKLHLIANGKFDERIDVQSSAELSELSDYINILLKSILENNIKMSYILNKTNLLIGIYEYNDTTSRVRFTEYMPQIFSLDSDETEKATSDLKYFKKLINKIRGEAVPNEPNVFMVGEKYVKFDEIKNGRDVFGVVMDVTNDIMKRKELETERDIDLLTGLYNRRGMDRMLTKLFANPDTLGYYALIMIDSDGLKTINDTYGHESGDIYLKKTAATINHFGTKNSIASRQGGDEFVLFLYGYDSEDELKKEIKSLESMQNQKSVFINKNDSVTLRFSLGYSIAKGNADYPELLKAADEKMYKNKANRKSKFDSGHPSLY